MLEVSSILISTNLSTERIQIQQQLEGLESIPIYIPFNGFNFCFTLNEGSFHFKFFKI